MKKILYVATVVKTHIMEFHIPYLKMLKEMGWETAVAARNDYDNPNDCVIPYCDTYFDIPFERNPLKPRNIKAYKNLKKIIDEGEYDIIHCHTPVGAMLTRLAARNARKKGTKIIYTAHGFHFYKGAPIINWLLYYPVEKYLSYFTDVLITINKEDYNRAKSFKARKVYYVPGVGIDLNKFNTSYIDEGEIRKELDIPKDAKVLLSVGEVNKNKNHRVGIEALAKVNDVNAYYVICGSGPLIESHMNLAKSLGVSDRVIFAGYRTDVVDFYKMADIFLFPSLREGLPVALMEAMACGLPIICSNIRGNTDLIEDKKEGLIVENNPEDIARAIESIQKNKKLQEELTIAAYQKIKKFDLNCLKDEVARIYRSEV